MAQLLSSVYADSVKFENPLHTSCSVSPWRTLVKPNTPWMLSCGSSRRWGCGRIKAVASELGPAEDIADDYYALLGVLPDATSQEIRKAYHKCMKTCHPDLTGNNDPEVMDFCTFINDVYAVLSDPEQRGIYDEIHGYALTARNPFSDDSSPKDHLFVDELGCIGCQYCVNICPGVFGNEEDFGRARVYNQRGDPESVQQAIESCPVDCIHKTTAAQLSLLEDEMRKVERVNVALMLSGRGPAMVDVFTRACTRWEKRQSKVLEKAKLRMMKQEKSDKPSSYWDNIQGKPKDYDNAEEEAQEGAKRAAAAARRWREYSRKAADNPSALKLPETVTK